MNNILIEYRKAFRAKDTKLILKLNKKYLQNDINDINDIVYILYENNRINHRVLRKIINMSIENYIKFDITTEFVGLIFRKKDGKALNLVLNNKLYNIHFIKFFLFKYKNKQSISTLELNKYCSDIKKIEEYLNSLIDNNCDTHLIESCREGNEKIAKCLINFGVNVNKKNKCGESPIFVASRFNHGKIFKDLFEHGASIEKKNVNPFFTMACRIGLKKAVNDLIKRGADVKKGDGNFNEPLCLACKNGHANVI